ncbi:MAG: spore coat protein YlbD [Bacilli bacterium]|nr:spore coat protein YlbD [Bacilli bacterium]MDD3304632.1 spore coat protein YlbD [Bacilli bacterium]MDD4053545.1 spore coat protein YlbD [Bacilli bacterium]MDD4411488.1 spore coat protein YlbD [Bacilli bacterium]
MKKIDGFKSFVKTKPSLISYVRKGDMTWQQFYEMWDLYGAEHEIWNNYNNTENNAGNNTTKQDALGLTDIFNVLRKVDMQSVRNNISGIQKAIGLIQEITNKGTNTDPVDLKEPYKPRPIYRRFED